MCRAGETCVDVDFAVARTAPYDGGAGRAAELPGRPEVGDNTP